MASGTAASVKLYATGLQRPRVLTVKIELMSACGALRHFAVVRQWVALGAKRKPPSMHRAISSWPRVLVLLVPPCAAACLVGQNTPSTPRPFSDCQVPVAKIFVFTEFRI